DVRNNVYLSESYVRSRYLSYPTAVTFLPTQREAARIVSVCKFYLPCPHFSTFEHLCLLLSRESISDWHVPYTVLSGIVKTLTELVPCPYMALCCQRQCFLIKQVIHPCENRIALIETCGTGPDMQSERVIIAPTPECVIWRLCCVP